MTAMAWCAATLLRVVRRLREFNAVQLELHERWLRHHGWPSPIEYRRVGEGSRPGH
jgi:hypothetical protein